MRESNTVLGGFERAVFILKGFSAFLVLREANDTVKTTCGEFNLAADLQGLQRKFR